MSHKKQDYPHDKIISIYQYMEICGVECARKDNVLLSHNAVLRKMMLRYKKFPDKVVCPVRLPFNIITKDSVYEGRILLVEDDYENIYPYLSPRVLSRSMGKNYTEEERKAIIEALLNETLVSKEEDVLKPGEIKYLVKSSNRRLKEEEEFLNRMLEEEENEIKYEVTESKNRILSLRKRQYY